MAETTASMSQQRRGVQKNPLDRRWECTHILSVFIFAVVIIISGLILCSIVNYSSSNKSNAKSEWVREDNMWTLYQLKETLKDNAVGSLDSYLNQSQNDPISTIAWYASILGVVMIGYLLLMRWLPRVCTTFGEFFLWSLILFTTFSLYIDISSWSDSNNFYDKTIYTIQDILRLIFYLTLGILCVRQAGVINIGEIVRQGLRAMFYFPSLILFGIFILILNVLIVYFVYSPIWYTRQEQFVYFIATFGSMYMYFCIYYFGRMVISQTIATWYFSKKNKDYVPHFTLFRCIGVVCRYHLGGVFLAATIILPFIIAIVNACRSKSHAAPKSGNRLIVIILKFFLVFNVADYALIITSIHGCNFFKATKKTFELMVNKCSLSLAVIYIFRVQLIVGLIIFSQLYAIICNYDSNSGIPIIDDKINVTYITSVIIPFTTSMLIFVFITAESAVHTTLLCAIEDDEKNKESNDAQCSIPLNEIA